MTYCAIGRGGFLAARAERSCRSFPMHKKVTHLAVHNMRLDLGVIMPDIVDGPELFTGQAQHAVEG
jgi:hypothetical protein